MSGAKRAAIPQGGAVGSNSFNNRRHAKPRASAQGNQRRPFVAPFEFIKDSAEQHRARRAEWMSECNRPAVDVQNGVVNVHIALKFQDNTCKNLVHFP